LFSLRFSNAFCAPFHPFFKIKDQHSHAQGTSGHMEDRGQAAPAIRAGFKKKNFVEK
jgi:hypothetical protein